MPAGLYASIAERLRIAQLAVSNSLAEAEIQSLVAGYGYPLTKLNEGKALYETAQAAVDAQKAAAGAQQLATQELEEAEQAAREAYQVLAKLARAVFVADKARLTILGLTGAMPRNVAGFLVAASALFENAAGVPALVDYGYDAARLEAEKAKVAAFDLADQKQKAAKGAAQQATRARDAALASLDAWRAQYIKIARLALRQKRELLEKLGIPARTSPRASHEQPDSA
jgi:hypothetical protein